MERKKMSLGRTAQNNLFMLRLIHQAAPGLAAAGMAETITATLAEFISGTLLLRFALNGIGSHKSFAQVAGTLVLWLTVRIFLQGFLSLYGKWVYPVRMTRVRRDVCMRVYQKAARVELGCYESPDYYDTFAKAMAECANRAEQLIQDLKGLVYLAVSFSANFVLVICVDPVFLLFALIPVLTVLLQAKRNRIGYEKEMAVREENRRKDYARRTFFLADYAKEMRLTNMPRLMVQRFGESGEKVAKILTRYGRPLAFLGYLIEECNELLTALGATMYAVWRTLGTKSMGYGDCIVIVNSIDNIAYSLMDSADVLLKFQENALYIENLRKFLEYEPQLRGGEQKLPGDGDIVLENVSFRYEGAQKDALHGVSMRFGAKEKVAIVGHNGAGKTTLVKLLLRLYDGEGCIRYGGTDIREFSLSDYRDMFACVMQDFHVFALSVADNVMLRSYTSGEEKTVEEALRKAGLAEQAAVFPEGIHTLMTKEFDEKGVQLSGGGQQKLAIAHVYSKENRFVLLDEPSSALDPIAEYEIYQQMGKACENCGMIFISHRLSSAVMADRIYLMEDGRVAECGTHRELMEKGGKYAEMFRKQAQNYEE